MVVNNYVNISIMQIGVPIIIALLSSILLTYFNKHYSTNREKNKYLDLLIRFSKQVDNFFKNIDQYEEETGKKYTYALYGFFVSLLYFIISIICFLIPISVFLENNSYWKQFQILNYFLWHSSSGMNSNVHFLLSMSTLNVFSITAALFILLWIKLLKSKKYINPKLSENLSLTFRSKCVYYSYYFSIGLLIGINTWILLFMLAAFSNFPEINENFSYSLTYISYVYTNLKTEIVAITGSDTIASIYTYSYLVGLGLSFILVLSLKEYINSFSCDSQEQIKNFYIRKFPYVILALLIQYS